ncbi:arrestin family protein Ecym_3558 [Eremothecium cymbalariae DBVPG|uniref:Arrestin C-terminal-like domain-containing protein n=1 Tax=Eremothecium cymbalariae (strain CBS 270.75 / DBVPG 7215 / KCTC 17166 / NRRL Y-17582) TaxID=931890 RepID=G8JQP5_ERECY|nr:Hypothetical protein Ecym_3558 [Eremothecium cymbalariae DBVPG\
MARTAVKAPALFDIRFSSCKNGVVILKGSSDEASSVLLSGKVVLSINEPIQIRHLNLGLYGALRVYLPASACCSTGTVAKPVSFYRKVFEHVWDDLCIQDGVHNNSSTNASAVPIGHKSKSSPNLPGLGKKFISSRSLMNISALNGGCRTLSEGNYEFPFSAILPFSMVESVEGLENASVTYNLVATLERGKFSCNFCCRKPIRVIRTLTPTSLGLTETIAVDNTWPGKVDYSISIPSKAVAIGSTIPLHILIVPLLKGLKLGDIRISILEYTSLTTPHGSITNDERLVMKMKLKDPLGHLSESDDDNEEHWYQDKWEISTTVLIPPSLSKCIQDCSIFENLKVRHKLKIVVALANPEGHVSELRASLPVQLFISPYIALGVKPSGPSCGSCLNDMHTENTDGPEELLFADLIPGLDMSDPHTSSNPVLLTPPNYGNHVYDRLWSNNLICMDSTTSALPSPLITSNSSHTKSIDRALFSRGLQDLEVERDALPGSSSNRSLTTRPKPVTINSSHGTSCLHNNANRVLESPTTVIPSVASHVSCDSAYDLIQPSDSSINSHWELDSMGEVPTYEKAVETDITGDELPPAYPDAEDRPITINLTKPGNLRLRESKFSSFGTTSNSSTAARQNLHRSASSSVIYHHPPPSWKF